MCAWGPLTDLVASSPPGSPLSFGVQDSHRGFLVGRDGWNRCPCDLAVSPAPSCPWRPGWLQSPPSPILSWVWG